MEKFVADTSPDAWGRLIDYYLELPSFGETWARHWMDLMRYAETHGSEGDPAIPGAWMYRDYLVRAFNSDLPYRRLVQEHIAGDLLEPRWNEAQGVNEALLGAANLRLMEHGFQPVDSLDEQVKTVDNQIDVLSKTFLGLTVSCARCHDHKFDAISQKDFYALYGILASTRPAQVVLDPPAKLDVHREELTRLKGQIKAELAELWLKSAETLPAQLLNPAGLEGNAGARGEIEAALADLRSRARAVALARKGSVVKDSRVPDRWPVGTLKGMPTTRSADWMGNWWAVRWCAMAGSCSTDRTLMSERPRWEKPSGPDRWRPGSVSTTPNSEAGGWSRSNPKEEMCLMGSSSVRKSPGNGSREVISTAARRMWAVLWRWLPRTSSCTSRSRTVPTIS